MYSLLAYCLFIASTLGATSFHHVTSLPHDVIPVDTSSTDGDGDERALVPGRDVHEAGNDVLVDADDSFSMSHGYIQKLDNDKPSDDQTLSNHNRKPTTGNNKAAKFWLGRSWSPSHQPQWPSLIGRIGTSGPSDSTEAERETKRQETRRQFKLGKKSTDTEVEKEMTANKRKMIKFGKKSLGKDSEEHFALA